jgi:co-chaperonin GroES (HSP10)
MRMSLDIKLHLFGERVFFEPVEEELTGSLALPERINKAYELGRVLLVGDGKVKDKDGNIKETKLVVKPGDIVWFQVIPQMAANCAVRIRGKTYLNVLQHDLIGRLKSTVVTLENFEILGHWVLLDSFEDPTETKIIIPDTVNETHKALRYFVRQKGEFATGYEVGDEVIIEKRAATLVAFNNVPYFYIDGRHITGTADSTPELEKAKTEKATLEKEKAKEKLFPANLSGAKTGRIITSSR